MAQRRRRNRAVGCRLVHDSGRRAGAVDRGPDRRCSVALSSRRRNQRAVGGDARIPGDELTVVVDLAQDNGAWVGSIIIPGLGVKGTPLTDIKVEAPDVSFAVKGPLGIKLNLRLLPPPENKLAGNFEQAGNRAEATLQKTGPPQVEYPPRSTAVAKELEGEWKGDYEMLGYTRHVSIKFANHPDGAAADFVIVGRKHNVLPVDLVTQKAIW